MMLRGTATNSQIAVISLITKCTEELVPTVYAKSFPNQKPWVSGSVRDKLKARSSAFNSGDPENLRKARYDLRKAINNAKRD